MRLGAVGEAATTAARPDDAFVAWLRPHWVGMTRLAQRLVGDRAAEDVVQEALGSAWRSRRRFDATQGAARAWLLAIVVNEARDHLRRERARETAPLTAAEPVGTDPGVASASGVDLTDALRRLTERQQATVALHYYCGLSVSESAQVLGCSVGTVKSTLFDARARLRAILGEDYR